MKQKVKKDRLRAQEIALKISLKDDWRVRTNTELRGKRDGFTHHSLQIDNMLYEDNYTSEMNKKGKKYFCEPILVLVFSSI